MYFLFAVCLIHTHTHTPPNLMDSDTDSHRRDLHMCRHFDTDCSDTRSVGATFAKLSANLPMF